MRWAIIKASTRRLGLIGQPGENGLAPALYDALFEALSLHWRCKLLSVPDQRLDQALQELEAARFSGLHVKSSHQEHAFRHLAKLTPAARTIQRVDFIYRDSQGRLVGDNIGWQAFLDLLSALDLPFHHLDPLVMGTNPLVKAPIYALLHQGIPTSLCHTRVCEGIEKFGHLRPASSEHDLSFYRWPCQFFFQSSKTHLILYAASPAEHFDFDDFLWSRDRAALRNVWILDLTPQFQLSNFVIAAQAAGAITVPRDRLLAHQAAIVFRRCTGQRPPLELLEQTLQPKAAV